MTATVDCRLVFLQQKKSKIDPKRSVFLSRVHRGPMDSPQEELEQIATWLDEEGSAADSPREAQLCLLWRALRRTRSRLSSVTREQDTQRSRHFAEMAEVRKSLEQIRIFTGHKDALAREIQDENDQLRDQLRRLISLQDGQISEVAKMLYQQGLTDLIHSSPSEQVAYLLVERASLLETSVDPANCSSSSNNNSMCAGNTTRSMGTETQAPNSNAGQSPHRGALHHGPGSWRRLFGLHKASHSKPHFIPAEARQLTGQSSSVARKCSRLELDLEEGSRRLAMAHNEIRRLTDELESAQLTQKAYEPELQAAQEEVEELKKCVAELRKAKELNDRLDLEIRALRVRVRCLDAEKSSLQQTVVSLQKEVERFGSALREQQQRAEQQLHTVQLQADHASELAKSQETELNRSNRLCRDLRNKLGAQTRRLLVESEIITLKPKEADLQHCENAHSQPGKSSTTEDKEPRLHKEIAVDKECPHHQDAVRTRTSTRDECETLKDEICETLQCLDKERSKYHEMKEKHKARLCWAKHKLDGETAWRDEKIKSLEREFSLCSHSLAKEKELVLSITAENEKLLAERTRLLQRLNEEEHNKKDSHLTAAVSKCRANFLEMENKKMGDKIIHISNQLAVLERTLQNTQSLHFAEELKKMYSPQHICTPLSAQASNAMMPKPSETPTPLDDTERSHAKQPGVATSPYCFLSAALSAEVGYPT
ncbi:paramyosin isoform X2 [Scophthalmus maximus]|uniref:paramyosin isoform X2 n=1 Tax=Scophthalmus maximus TaxID=52904 RepID=UPI001FA8FDBA|nr:paramyosin isoform X2 [Scophthalmus maximus]